MIKLWSFCVFFIVSFIVPHHFYRFKGIFPYHLYRGSIKFLPMTVQNDKGHLLTSAGVWSLDTVPRRGDCLA